MGRFNRPRCSVRESVSREREREKKTAGKSIEMQMLKIHLAGCVCVCVRVRGACSHSLYIHHQSLICVINELTDANLWMLN